MPPFSLLVFSASVAELPSFLGGWPRSAEPDPTYLGRLRLSLKLQHDAKLMHVLRILRFGSQAGMCVTETRVRYLKDLIKMFFKRVLFKF